MTNNHVLDKEYLEKKNHIKIILNYNEFSIDLNKERRMWTNDNFDYTIIETLEIDNLNNDFLVIDENINLNNFSNSDLKGKSIILPAIMESQQIEVGPPGIIEYNDKNNYLFHHKCNTDSGSSGGPVVLIENFKVIGIHIGHDKLNNKNVGIFLSNVLNDIKNKENLIIRQKEENKNIDNFDIININKILNENIINEKNEKVIENQADNICKVFINNKEIGIGFLSLIPYPDKLNQIPVLFIYSEILKENKEKKIILKFTKDNKEDSKELLISKDRKIYYNKNITIIEIKQDEDFDFNTFLEIDNSNYDNFNNFKKVYLISDIFKNKYHLNEINIKNDNEYIMKNKINEKFIFSPLFDLSNNKIFGIFLQKNEQFEFINTITNDFYLSYNKSNNKIILKIKIEKNDINKEIYYLDNTIHRDKKRRGSSHEYLKELNEKNVKLILYFKKRDLVIENGLFKN